MKNLKCKRWLAILMASVVIASGSSIVLATSAKKVNAASLTYAAQTNFGWKKIGDYWYFFNSNGQKVTGIYNTGDGKYYFDSQGRMQTNCWAQNARGVWYYFGSDGKAITGWAKIGGYWYYFHDDDYHMYTGLHYEKWAGEWNRYYFESNGHMAANKWIHEYYWYYALSDGSLANGWHFIDGYWYYFMPETGVMKTGWLKYNGAWYYLEPNGHMAIGWRKIDGHYYCFTEYDEAGNKDNTNLGKMKVGYQYVVETDLDMFYFGVGGHNYYFHKPGDNYPEGSLAIDEDIYFYTSQGWVKYHAESDGRVVYAAAMEALEILDGMNIGSDIPSI